MQRCGVAFGCHTGPFAQRVKRYINIVRAIAAFVAGRGPDEMFARIQAQRMLRIFDIDAVKVGVVRLPDLGAVQLRAADEQMNQMLRPVETGERDQIQERS